MLNLSKKGILDIKVKWWVLKNGLTNYLMSCASIDADSADYYKSSFHLMSSRSQHNNNYKKKEGKI